jgi:hypothetical protein
MGHDNRFSSGHSTVISKIGTARCSLQTKCRFEKQAGKRTFEYRTGILAGKGRNLATHNTGII